MLSSFYSELIFYAEQPASSSSAIGQLAFAIEFFVLPLNETIVMEHDTTPWFFD